MPRHPGFNEESPTRTRYFAGIHMLTCKYSTRAQRLFFGGRLFMSSALRIVALYSTIWERSEVKHGIRSSGLTCVILSLLVKSWI